MVSEPIEQKSRRSIGRLTRYALMIMFIAIGAALIVFGDRWVIFIVDELAKLPGGGWIELFVPPATVAPFFAAAYIWSLPTQ